MLRRYIFSADWRFKSNEAGRLRWFSESYTRNNKSGFYQTCLQRTSDSGEHPVRLFPRVKHRFVSRCEFLQRGRWGCLRAVRLAGGRMGQWDTEQTAIWLMLVGHGRQSQPGRSPFRQKSTKHTQPSHDLQTSCNNKRCSWLASWALTSFTALRPNSPNQPSAPQKRNLCTSAKTKLCLHLASSVVLTCHKFRVTWGFGFATSDWWKWRERGIITVILLAQIIKRC